MNVPPTTRWTPQRHETTWYTSLALNPALTGPVRQDGDEREGRRDGEPFKVPRFTPCVFWNQCDRRVEASESSEPTAYEAC